MFIVKRSNYMNKKGIVICLTKVLNIVLVPYMDSAHNMDTPNIFKSNKFYRHMALRAHKEKQLKR